MKRIDLPSNGGRRLLQPQLLGRGRAQAQRAPSGTCQRRWPTQPCPRTNIRPEAPRSLPHRHMLLTAPAHRSLPIANRSGHSLSFASRRDVSINFECSNVCARSPMSANIPASRHPLPTAGLPPANARPRIVELHRWPSHIPAKPRVEASHRLWRHCSSRTTIVFPDDTWPSNARRPVKRDLLERLPTHRADRARCYALAQGQGAAAYLRVRRDILNREATLWPSVAQPWGHRLRDGVRRSKFGLMRRRTQNDRSSLSTSCELGGQ